LPALIPLKHQLDGADTLAVPKRGILADHMGLGKTGTAVLLIHKIAASRSLVVGPKEVCRNLQEEIPKWTDLPVIGIKDRSRLERDIFLTSLNHLDRFVILMNLEAWSRDKEVILKLLDLQLDFVVVDEAHNINNTRTSAYKGLREITFAINKCPTCAALLKPTYRCQRNTCIPSESNRFRYCLSCGHQQALISLPECSCGTRTTTLLKQGASVQGILHITGTPIINYPTDLFPLVHLVDPAMFPSEKSFKNSYTYVGQGNKRTYKEGAQEQIIRALGSRYVARSQEDAGIVLPPQTTEILEYDRDTTNYAEQWKAYDLLEEMFALSLGGQLVPVTEIIVQITRLRQMVTWPQGIVTDEGTINVSKSQKLDIVESKINEYLRAQQRIIAFSQLTAPLHELQRRLGHQAVVYDGSTPTSLRERIRRDFGSKHRYPEWSVLLCNYKTGGASLTLIGATQAIRIDEEWSPAKNRQADGRINRIGQTEATRVHIPRISKTIDTWMAALNEFKHEMSGAFSQLDILKAIKEKE
jgi:SNF2 family DNA or RNA helicase